jgi:hypothetical protein
MYHCLGHHDCGFDMVLEQSMMRYAHGSLPMISVDGSEDE